MEKSEALAYIENHSLIGIKAGKERDRFLEIWMVVVENRIFARSWGFAEKSWYNTFLKDHFGQIKCGERIFDITGKIPEDIEDLTEKINDAYLRKYDSGQNSFYAKGITEQNHVEKTMEFILK